MRMIPRNLTPLLRSMPLYDFFKGSARKAGQPPGALTPPASEATEPTRISRIEYGPELLVEQEGLTAERACEFEAGAAVRWLHVEGVHDVDAVESVGRYFDIHPLILADAVNTSHRPKMDEFDDYCFFVVKSVEFGDAGLDIRQAAIALGRGFVISFCEGRVAALDAVRERIRTGRGRIRKMGADYLCYALIDAVVDGYFMALEQLAEEFERLEEMAIAAPQVETLVQVQAAKRSMIMFRKSVWPLREAVSALSRGESEFFSPEVDIFLRDIHDHTIQVVETVETFKDILAGIQDLYLSSAGNRLNQIMKVLTIVGAIFIPLTFVAGVYGMNFENMPELGWPAGYFAVLGFMGFVAAGMIWLFKRSRWL